MRSWGGFFLLFGSGFVSAIIPFSSQPAVCAFNIQWFLWIAPDVWGIHYRGPDVGQKVGGSEGREVWRHEERECGQTRFHRLLSPQISTILIWTFDFFCLFFTSNHVSFLWHPALNTHIKGTILFFLISEICCLFLKERNEIEQLPLPSAAMPLSRPRHLAEERPGYWKQE